MGRHRHRLCSAGPAALVLDVPSETLKQHVQLALLNAPGIQRRFWGTEENTQRGAGLQDRHEIPTAKSLTEASWEFWIRVKHTQSSWAGCRVCGTDILKGQDLGSRPHL